MTWVMVPIFRREHFRLAYYMKHYECIIPVLFMLGDLTWIVTSSLHGIYNYDIIVSNAARDRHEEYDQFLRFRSHQWYVTEGLREAHKRPRKDIYELYVEMEKKDEESRGIKRPCICVPNWIIKSISRRFISVLIGVLHVIDRVLEPPPPTSTGNPPTALDLIDAFADDATLRATKFRDKIAKYKMWDAFNASAPSTFLVPIDAGVAGARARLLDRYVVDAHVVPDQVLFWRPAAKNFYRETRANGDYVYVLVKFVETDGKRYVRSSTVLGDSDHAKGETQSEIVKANVPVSNGVVHFIKRPIAIIDAKLPLFPNQQIIDKLAADPTLSKTYELGERSGFNRNLRRRKSSLMTYFVPSDVAWSRVATPRGDEARRALARHLVVSDVGFTMKRLMELSKNGNLTMVMMGGDQLDVRVVKENGDYYVIVGRKWVRVARPDYMCQDGVVHVVDEVMVEDAGASLDGRPFALNFWQSVKDVLFG